MAGDCAISIGAKILKLSEPVLTKPLRPIFCFQSIVDEFEKEHEKLSLEQARVQDDVTEANDNALVIYDQVNKWLEEVKPVMEDAQSLQNELKEDKSCCFSTGWTYHYRLSKKLLANTKSIKKLSETVGSINQVAHPVDLRQHIGLAFSEAFIDSKSADTALCVIVEALMKDGVDKIGLHGMGGTGKTTLVKQVFKEAERLMIVDRVVMITVPQSPEMIRSIQGTIADFLNLKLELESEEGRASKLHQRLKNGQKILIILDDVWKEFDLATVGIQSFGCCKVLLTTHDLQICNSMQTQQNIQLGALSENEAWALFKSVAGVGDPLRKHDATKKVIAFCNNLPKALVVVGRTLRGKSHSEWEEALQRLKDDQLKIIVDDLHKENMKLRLTKDRVQNQVEIAKNNAQVIEKDVERWLADAKTVMEDVDKFLNELKQTSNCFCLWDGVITKKAEQQTTIVKKLCDDGKFDQVAHFAPIRQDRGLFSVKDFIPSKSADSALCEITAALKKEDVNMIGLYGIQGIGKTTLAKKLAKEVLESFKDIINHVIMVTISETPLVKKIQGVIADFLNLELKQESEEGRARRLNQRLMTAEKILIILDDLREWFDLASIGINEECKGCKIMLIARDSRVCNSMKTQPTIPLNLLSEDEARGFFKKKANLADEFKLGIVEKLLVDDCKCLPGELKNAGEAYGNKSKEEWIESLKERRVPRPLDTLGEVGDDIDKNAYKSFRYSYDCLKYTSEPQAQLLFLLCALFPKDHEICIEDLTASAYGMELFQRVESIRDVRIKVRAMVGLLKNSDLLLHTDDKESVKMDDMVRNVALLIGRTEFPERNVFTVRDGTDLKNLVKKESFKNCRALSFMPDSLSDLQNYELVCPNLETMLIFCGSDPPLDVELPVAFFTHMKALKVLQVRDSKERGRCNLSLPESIRYLTNLRTLNLRCCDCNNSILIRDLINLEILCLDDVEIDCALEAISALKKLRLLDLMGLKYKGISLWNVITNNFLKLEELYTLDVYSYESWEIERELPNLVSLSTQVGDFSHFSFPNLESYHITVNIDNSYGRREARFLSMHEIQDRSELDVFSKLLSTVEELHLSQPGESLENIIPTCTDERVWAYKELTSLEIYKSYGMTSLVDTLTGDGQLIPCTIAFPSLVKLKLDTMYSLRALCHGPPPRGFLQKLEELYVDECNELETLFEFQALVKDQVEQFVSLRNIREIQIWNCSKLKRIFSSVSFTQNLEQLEILQIDKCDALEEVISDSAPNDDISCCFQKLRKLSVSRCKKLKTIILVATRARRTTILHLPKLQELRLSSNAKLEHVVGHQYEVEQLHHWDCSFEWLSLKDVFVASCPKLCLHFLQSQVQVLSAAKRSRHMDNMRGGDELWTSPLKSLRLEDLAYLNCIWSGPAQNIFFSYLVEIELTNCNSLKHIFTTAIARSLKKLESLRVENCNEVEQMIDDGDINDSKRNITTIITFDNLASLKLRHLQRLVMFCPAAFVLELPCLTRKSLYIAHCRNTITDFFRSRRVSLKE